MAELRARALLLRRVPYGDSSLICHLLIEHHGRLSLMARGARRARSPLRASLQPLYLLQIRWRPGRTGMGYLQEVVRGPELVPQARMLEGLELLAMAAGLYRDRDPNGFDELRQALHHLAHGAWPGAQWAAMWRLLELCGWVGDLEHCWRCDTPIERGVPMGWHSGMLMCPACGGGRRLMPETRGRMRDILAGESRSLSPAEGRLWQEMIASVLRRHHIRHPMPNARSNGA